MKHTKNYKEMSDAQIAAERLLRFYQGPPPEGNQELNAEFRKRFPKMEDKKENPIFKEPQPSWMTDETPSFLEEVPPWMVETAKKKGKKLSMFSE